MPISSTARTALVCGLALFGLYVPSSVSGLISHPLNVVALIGTMVGIAALLVTSPSSGPRRAVQAACLIASVLAGATVLSPFIEVSPGVVVLYAVLGLLLATDLRGLQSGTTVVRCFAAVSVVSLLVGTLLVADVQVVDRTILAWYTSFRPELATEMVVLDHKPVLTFGTHSMASFMVYLFFHMSLSAYQAGRGRTWLLAAAGYLWLLTHLHATTATLLLLLAGAELIWIAVRPAPRSTRLASAGVAAMAVVGAAIWLAAAPAAADAVRVLVLGDSSHGFIARYGAGGLLAANLDYLAAHPFAPIGVTFTPSLYLGDSGVVINALRGSLPLVVVVYGGVLAFAMGNLRSRFDGILLGCLIAAFELGFTPLQYFRFLAVLPLIVVFMNSIHPGTGAGATMTRPLWSACGQALWHGRWVMLVAALAGIVLGGVLTRVTTSFYTTETVLRVGPTFLLENSRRWYASQVEAMAKGPEVFAAAIHAHPHLAGELGMAPESFRTLGLVAEQRDDGRYVAIRLSLARAETVELLANAIADELIGAAHERYRPVQLPPERTLKLEVVSRATAQEQPRRAIPLAALLGALAGAFGASAWALGRPVAVLHTPVAP